MAKGLERRAYTRYQVDWGARIITKEGAATVGRIRDVSLGGALMECNRFFDSGKRVKLEIFPQYRGKQQLIRAAARVIYSKQLPNGNYIFGTEFMLVPDNHRKLLLNIITVQAGYAPIFDDRELDLS